jgi:pimeloyl-ACP methyl ester carboxylesterase
MDGRITKALSTVDGKTSLTVDSRQYGIHTISESSDSLIVFLHEGLGCNALWTPWARGICSQFQSSGILIERPGHGRTPPPDSPRGEFYLQEEAKHFESLLLQIGNPPVTLIGHSDGGTIAILTNTGRVNVQRTVCIAGHLINESVTTAGIRKTVDWYKNGDLRSRLEKYHGGNTDRLFDDWQRIWLSDAFTNWNIQHEASCHLTPVLVVQGDRDPYATQAQVSAIMDALKGEATEIILKDCGHSPHAEAPDQLSDAIADFFEVN